MASLFRHIHRVTYAECTISNHVYHARYLDMLESARGEFFRHLGLTFLDWQERDVLFPVIECRLRYQAPARYDDALTIEVWPVVDGRTRLNFCHVVRNQVNRVLVEAETFHVCTGINEKPKRLPQELLAKLSPFLAPDPGDGGVA